ncbi:MAG: hypothetical protein GX173_10405 [Ruminococcaceae bacterium]|nr:hypothetical protein [Oscillospiraceae bacterium]
MAYPRKVKETAIRMMLAPENKSINQIEQMLGIPDVVEHRESRRKAGFF